MMLVLAASAALLWLNQLVHPTGDWLAANDRCPSTALAGVRQFAAT
jgi:hypothetical protein